MIENQKRFFGDRKSHLSDLEDGVAPHLFIERLTQYIQFIDELTQKQTISMGRLMEVKLALLNAHAGKLDAVSPLGTLSRGYSITLKLPGKTLVQKHRGC